MDIKLVLIFIIIMGYKSSVSQTEIQKIDISISDDLVDSISGLSTQHLTKFGPIGSFVYHNVNKSLFNFRNDTAYVDSVVDFKCSISNVLSLFSYDRKICLLIPYYKFMSFEYGCLYHRDLRGDLPEYSEDEFVYVQYTPFELSGVVASPIFSVSNKEVTGISKQCVVSNSKIRYFPYGLLEEKLYIDFEVNFYSNVVPFVAPPRLSPSSE